MMVEQDSEEQIGSNRNYLSFRTALREEKKNAGANVSRCVLLCTLSTHSHTRPACGLHVHTNDPEDAQNSVRAITVLPVTSSLLEQM
jgi:hypothetical protein